MHRHLPRTAIEQHAGITFRRIGSAMAKYMIALPWSMGRQAKGRTWLALHENRHRHRHSTDTDRHNTEREGEETQPRSAPPHP